MNKVQGIRKDIKIDSSFPEPIPELLEEIEWLYGQAKSGNLRELIYSASDMGTEPIYGQFGESVNYPMMAITLDLIKQMYLESVVFPTMRGNYLEDLDE